MSESRPRILLVEDDEDHVELIRRAFESRAQQVNLTAVTTLGEARDQLARELPNLMIVDLRLPDGSGAELLPGGARERVFPIIMMTSFGDEKAAVEAMKAGALDYIVKSNVTLADMPHVTDRALHQWENIVQRKRAEEELARHRDHLEEVVRERTAELEKTNRQLRQEIAERRQVERDLRSSEERFRMLFQTTPHGIVEVDTSGNVKGSNRAYQRLLGYSGEELLQMNAVDVVFEGDRPRLIADLKRFAADQLGPSLYEVRHLTKDGRIIDCEAAWDYKRDSQGKPVGTVTVVTDVTERKRAAKALQKEQRLLRQLLDLQERERKLVAYEIHDGVSQQLTGAVCQLQTYVHLRGRKTEQAQSAFDAGLEALHEAVEETRRLIGGLRPMVLDQSGIMAAIDYLIGEHQKRGGPAIEFVHHDRFARLAPPLETAIFRVIQETLTNACRYSRSEKVRIELAQEYDRVRIEVQDWGVGFDPDKVEENRFGLRGIRERARLLGGQATVDTAPNKGTRVVVELPLVEEAPGEGGTT